jgi:hypothetical protein
LNPVSTASNLPGQTWTTESSESAAEGVSVDGDKRRILQTPTPGNIAHTNPKLIQSNPTRFLCHNILMESNLANELKSLFHGVAGNKFPYQC